ncbi:hypothetical protein [Candidatus Cyanaurora vandensis]|uniref:hypothetical protein n=1 Tax=Candidatus Cyanaurora vandensis TaxID=2714958 RepID=UPI0025795C98|nr:hypothetical protein [Candidatus Cyanaurora vandensis]
MQIKTSTYRFAVESFDTESIVKLESFYNSLSNLEMQGLFAPLTPAELAELDDDEDSEH